MKLKRIGGLLGMVFGFGAGSVWIYGCEPACERTLTCGDESGSETVEDAGVFIDADAADTMVLADCYLGEGLGVTEACSAPCCQQCPTTCVDGGSSACQSCIEGFDTYWPASAELLASSLSGLLTKEMCVSSTIQIYEALVAQNACDPNGFADATCNQVSQLCFGKFTVATCSNALRPFRDQAHEAYINCMTTVATKGDDCDLGHTACLKQVRNLDLP